MWDTNLFRTIDALDRQMDQLRLRIREGEVLSREHLEESRANLYATGYFARVDLVPENPEASQGSVNLMVRVIERKMRFIGLGLGYGTHDQFRISGEWGHRRDHRRAADKGQT